MTEVAGELSIMTRIRHLGDASRDLMATISESKTNYWASYVADLVCPFLFVYLGMRHGTSRPAIVATFVFGVAVFSLIEYSIHRWLLHDPKSALFPLHEAHHNNPNGLSAFLFPTSLLVLGLVWLIFSYGLHVPYVSFFIAGVGSGYFYFGVLHHVEHSTRINQIPFRWLQKRWAAHSVHHHLDQSNFGVTTSFWDYVFGTHQKQMKRRQTQG